MPPIRSGATAIALLAVDLAIEVMQTLVVHHHLGVDTIVLVAMAYSPPTALDQRAAGESALEALRHLHRVDHVADQRRRTDLSSRRKRDRDPPAARFVATTEPSGGD